MIVGVAIAFIQALTQVQEMTLPIVPKIVTIMFGLGVGAPFVGAQLWLFFQSRLFTRAIGLLISIRPGCHPRASFGG
jgi:flagellar biosynthesis protein FliQ